MSGVSLYAHIPFCAAKCGYCSFYSLVGDERAEGFAQALLAEIDSVMDALGLAHFETVYVGGGSPNSLDIRILEGILSGIASRSAGPDEFTVELNPEFVTRDQISMLAASGVSRASLGVQSLSDDALRASGRRADAGETIRAIEALSRHWPGALSADLIAGLPGQKEGDVARAAAALVGSGFDHISLYELAVEKGSPLWRVVAEGSADVPGDDARWALWDEGAEELERRGLGQYEVSNFCAPGRECAHNMRYWELEPYIGAGPSAVGTIPADRFGRAPFAEPGAAALRLGHEPSLDAYLGDPSRYDEREALDRSTWAKDGLIMGMRLARGIHRGRYEDRFGANIDRLIGRSVAAWKGRGMLIDDAEGLRLSKEGLRFLNAFLVDCLREIDETAVGAFGADRLGR